jgi:hypothetical protein
MPPLAFQLQCCGMRAGVCARRCSPLTTTSSCAGNGSAELVSGMPAAGMHALCSVPQGRWIRDLLSFGVGASLVTTTQIGCLPAAQGAYALAGLSYLKCVPPGMTFIMYAQCLLLQFLARTGCQKPVHNDLMADGGTLQRLPRGMSSRS